MTTLVTGATGHVGANLLRSLLAQDRTTRALVHIDRKAIDGLDIEIAEGDICNLASLSDAFHGVDVVYHLAAHISISNDKWSRFESVNVTGTRNVVEACIRSGVRRLVHFSSLSAMSPECTDFSDDTSVLLADSNRQPSYDRSKAVAEREIYKGIEKGLDAIIISPTAVIGPYDYRPSHFGEALVRLANGKLPALIGGGYDWVDVRDVIGAAMRAEERASTGARYIISGHWVSVCDMAAIVEQITGVPAPRLVCPLWLGRISAPVVSAFDRIIGRRPLYTRSTLKILQSYQKVSCQKAMIELEYNPRPFRETIVDTLRWFEEAGWLTHPLPDLYSSV
ncbi:SDR family oxidoreductase [Chloroflexota bacterium]